MAHGATRKIRRYALSYWMDLRGLDKRQQRRRVREDAREAAKFAAACELMPGMLFQAPTLSAGSHWLRSDQVSQAIGMSVLAPSPRPIVSDVS